MDRTTCEDHLDTDSPRPADPFAAPRALELTGTMALVVDDDSGTADAIARVVASFGHEVVRAHSIEQARAVLERQTPELALVDLGLPDGNGARLVEELRRRGVPYCIVVSGERCQSRTVESLRAGAVDFLTKPVRVSELQAAVGRVIDTAESARIGIAWRAPLAAVEPATFVGGSPAICRLREMVERAARVHPIRALVAGPGGVGKRHVAARLHAASGAAGRVVFVDCAGEIDEAAPLRWWGRVGSVASIEGYVARAHGGTLVLDDLSLLPLHTQSALAGFLHSGAIVPVDGIEPVRVNCSVVALLREPIREALSSGRLRADLYHALGEAILPVPALAERGDDVLAIADRILVGLDVGHRAPRIPSSELRARMRDYAWPGNVVELRGMLRAAHAYTAPGDEIGLDEAIPPALTARSDTGVARLVGKRFRDVRRELLRATLDHVGGNKRKAADVLGISLKSVHNWSSGPP